ncbi:HTH-type transcriptional regulator RafR [Aquimixticola soesokkakensis]|uniref:HTH-type transcriptional regulator RafR n=1 Tax=Aquimixticola soesokkakensis TaxID=1519096 RepID=A0A1Y5TI87_9RHOB|nr:substrate-binding domain-containing protein [Aquimixticola soesokkakensis]SLN64738.1 HTH-type transcriptional regulator RafR [Aquimixticola soesokkakensis]
MNLKELSSLLGLSQTTVSRALNGYPEVSEATRKKVTAMARAHGYAPNARARGLATGRTMSIGHVIPLSTRHEIVNPVFSDFVAGASEIYSANGYDMLLTVVPDQGEAEAYRKITARQTVDGVIVHGPKAQDGRIALLREIGMPFVVHGRMSADDTGYAWVDMNNVTAFSCAADCLIDLGHRRIGLLNGLETLDFALRRREGVQRALAAAGIEAQARYFLSDEMTEGFGYRATCALLDLDEPPTALIVSSLIIGIGVRRAAEERGLKLGRELSLIVHDDDLSYLRNGSETGAPVFTATQSSVRDAGRMCAQNLLDIIAAPDTAARFQTELEAKLVMGSSTGPCPV